MIVTGVSVSGFRNIGSLSFQPDEKYNIITGMNAQGKTNLLESMWILTGCRSFRGAKERDFINNAMQKMSVNLTLKDSLREQKISYELRKGPVISKNITLNGVKMRNTGSLFDVFRCIVFTPDDTSLIKGSPEKRRNFVDMAASQLMPQSLRRITRHNAIMNQRNSLLKDILGGRSKKEELIPWDRQAAKEGAYISYMRNDYIKRLNESCAELYSLITGGRESLEISYRSNVFKNFDTPFSNEAVQHYYSKLREMTDYDIKSGCTHAGANRDEISIKINGFSARDFGSQGQIKSSALVMKLAQAEIYMKQNKEPPVVFLDDVMGELDESRQRLVYSIVKDMQVFITTCNESALLPEIKGRVISIENGEIV